jgi:hypothetical protein
VEAVAGKVVAGKVKSVVFKRVREYQRLLLGPVSSINGGERRRTRLFTGPTKPLAGGGGSSVAKKPPVGHYLGWDAR